jgi:hypothetical protein
MTPTLIGYFPRRTVKRVTWTAASVPSPFPFSEVHEIGSVSECISKGPGRWTEDLTPNSFWGFADPESAWAAVVPEDRPGLELFAYRLYPVRFVEGRQEALELPALDVEPLADDFIRLGWDAVEIGGDAGHCHFGCSPLSCNSQAGQPGLTPVNRHCLVASEEAALKLARTFSITKPEPGPYCVVEVWRAAARGSRHVICQEMEKQHEN